MPDFRTRINPEICCMLTVDDRCADLVASTAELLDRVVVDPRRHGRRPRTDIGA
jgi:hypothetical protein